MLNITPYPYKIMEGNGYFPIGSELLTLKDFEQIDNFRWLRLVCDDNFSVDGNSAESYRLEITQDGVVVTSACRAGVFYAFVTLIQLASAYDNNLPCAVIEDKPQYSYRGFMMDVGRYFYSVDEIKKLVDLCALHKINIFHWHLTEDQGWRIEIKKYPLLATKGGWRTHTNFNCKKHGGFYTQTEIKDIVAYCHARQIEVIPEIDMPGHMQAAISCYPYLSCFDRDLPVATHWGVKHDILCAGKDATYRFVYDVLDEIIELFDSKYIHIGGDEAPKMRWEICPNCQAKMKAAGLENCDQLQAYFMNKIAQYLSSKGKTAIMWNEIYPSGTVGGDITWQIWHFDNKEKLKDIVDDCNAKSRKVIYSFSGSTYLDLPYKMVPVERTYKMSPELDGLNPQNMLGVEAPLWTEYVPTYRKAIYMTIPRLGSLSELMWSPIGGRLFSDWRNRLDGYNKFLAKQGYTPTKMQHCFPNKLRASAEASWFNRRPLHWHGLHNLIDDAKVKKLANKQAQPK
ncbi:MAG: beta-N-acetylhexosaminidase [Clostridia bacterium]